ncbi:MAG: hypothetical protein KatS3mg129_1954 [Leptospiraceae bacterium]|nr:MAG: hypothetical protein KatS3mg129_1954 [Leptospiraceae bacterium]
MCNIRQNNQQNNENCIPKSQEKYYNRFLDLVQKSRGKLLKDPFFKFKCKKNSIEIFKEALKYAHDLRKFEIELYWRRALYFWGFITVLITLYSGLFKLIIIKKLQEDLYLFFILIIINLMGILFSFGFYLANRGSKFWQENWEAHVSYLEDIVTGPLLKTIRHSNKTFWNLLSEYPYSVSKINLILSLVILIFWIYILIFNIKYIICDKLKKLLDSEIIVKLIFSLDFIMILIILFSLLFIFIFPYFAKSRHSKYKCSSNNNTEYEFISIKLSD